MPQDAVRPAGPASGEDTVSLIVVNWNARDLLVRCLRSIYGQTRIPDQVIVVDNGSVDGSAQTVRGEFPAAEVVALDTNTGFAHAANEGLRRATGTFVCLVNNDAELAPDWVAELLGALAASAPTVGYATSKIVSIDGTHIDSAGDYLDNALVPHQLGHGEPDRGQYQEVRPVTSACAGATMYRKAFFDDVGDFDARFFAYFEDVDLSLRGRLLGWSGIYVPTAVTHHVMSATSSRIPGFKRYHGTRNIWFLLVKCAPTRLMPTILPRFLATQVLWLVGAIRDGEGRVAFRAHRHGLAGCVRMFGDRRRIARTATVDAASLRADLRPAHVVRVYLHHLGRLAARLRRKGYSRRPDVAPESIGP